MVDISKVALITLIEACKDRFIKVSNLVYTPNMAKSIVEELEYKGLVEYVGDGVYSVTYAGYQFSKYSI